MQIGYFAIGIGPTQQPLHMPLSAGGKLPEAVFGDSCKQRFLVREMTIGGWPGHIPRLRRGRTSVLGPWQERNRPAPQWTWWIGEGRSDLSA